MDIKKITTYIIVGLLSFTFHAEGQTLKQYLKSASESFYAKDYYSAMTYYDIAHEIEEKDMDILYKYAESARLFEAYTFADTAYTEVLYGEDGATYPMAAYWLATVKKRIGYYDDAAQLFQKFLDANLGTHDEYIETAKKELADCEWAIEVVNEPDENFIIEQLGENINTTYSDFGASQIGEKFYFSSYSFTKENDNDYPKRQYSKILMTEDDGESVFPVVFNDNERHTANSAFNKDQTRIYYTLCDYSSITEIQCEIYYRSVDEDGNFGEAVKLPSHINEGGTTNTQPNVGFDKATGKEWLFFVSDREKGKGKLDIWATYINDDDTFSQPFSLSLNSTGDDISPFFHNESQTLYFSSDGRHTLGGYDVYHALKKDQNWSEPEHMPVPVNSSYDDAFFVLNEGGTGGHLASKRLGSNLLDPLYEACCFDIYKFTIDLIDLNALTFNRKGGEALPGVTLELFEIIDGVETKLSSSTNEDGNDFDFELKKGRKYVLIGNKPGFVTLREEIDLTNPELTQSSTLERELYLTPTTVDLEVFTFNKKSMRPLPGVEVRLAIDGQEVAYQKNDNGNNVEFILERGKKYQLIGSRVAFIPDTIIIDLTNELEILEMEEKLLLRPKEIREFPPLLLYFDNDIPAKAKGQSRTKTNYTYGETYEAYLTQRDLFITEYTKVLAGRDSTLAGGRIRAFFDRELRNGYESLMVFSENLQETLEKGIKVQLEIQGFTSPLAEESYNELLSKRRANCLKNHFEQFNSGVLRQYMESGQMTIVEVGYGEKFAPQFISDRLDDERESIYSIAASSERKVAIVGVRVDSGN